jgi:hypothetical protein
MAGGGLSVSGSATVTGAGVTIFFLGSGYTAATPYAGGAYGSISVIGSAKVTLAPPVTGAYAGIVLAQPAANTKPLALSGAALSLNGGIVYAPASALTVGGSAQLTHDPVVVGTLNLTGAAGINARSGLTAYRPDQVRTAYGVDKLHLDGSGQTIAIVDAYGNPAIEESVDEFDVQFAAASGGPTLYDQYGAAASFLTEIGQDGTANLPGVDPAGAGVANWEMEAALDVQWAHAMAPAAKIVLVEANSPAMGDLMAAVKTAASLPGVSVVSMSWGFVEGLGAVAADEAQYDQDLTTPAGHQGVTFVASTGDFGAAVPQYPAFSPNVVAVGGTSLGLNADGSYGNESGWGYLTADTGTFIGSGGGISQFEAEPAFQQGVQATGKRATPDVAFLADPATGVWVADSYNLPATDPWVQVGGTSLAAPAWAGLLALANQARIAAGSPTLGTAGPTETQDALYSIPATDYHAIATGTNGFAAGLGYNLVTGLGTPDAGTLIPDVAAYNGGAMTTGSAGQRPIATAGLNFDAGVFNGGQQSVATQMNAFAVLNLDVVGWSGRRAGRSSPRIGGGTITSSRLPSKTTSSVSVAPMVAKGIPVVSSAVANTIKVESGNLSALPVNFLVSEYNLGGANSSATGGRASLAVWMDSKQQYAGNGALSAGHAVRTLPKRRDAFRLGVGNAEASFPPSGSLLGHAGAVEGLN